jgi:hypothetical protein
MQQFLASVRAAVTTRNWVGALFITLSLPDICAALETGEASGKRYKDWFNRYLKAEYDPTPSSAISLSEAQIQTILADMSIANAAGDTQQVEALYNMLPVGNFTPAGTAFTADDCYRFRCKSLHQGVSERRGAQKIEFSPPPESGITMHRCLYNNTYILSIDEFCEDVCLAVEQWLIDKADDVVVQQRISELMSPYSRLFR